MKHPVDSVAAQDIRALSAIALRVAREAGDLASRGFRQPKAVHYKSPIDVVTEFDLASEELVRERLAVLAPGVAVVAEEKGGLAAQGLTFFVDPIDGTTNYAHGHPFWCVSVGLAVDGFPLAGAVVAPSLGWSFVGSVAEPSTRNGEPCHVSSTATLGEALLATGFPFDRRTSADDNIAAFAHMKREALGVRRCGSAALDLCLVADGTYDAYWEGKLGPWDYAAGAAIVRAAGGSVTDLSGEPLRVDPPAARRTDYLVASNGILHPAVLEGVRRARAGAGC